MKQLAGIVAVAAIAFGIWQISSSNSADAADATRTEISNPAPAPAPVAQAQAEAADPHAGHDHAAPAAADTAVQTAQLLPAPFEEGRHYRRHTPALSTQSPPDTIEVIEFFMYSCPHCFSMEPEVQRWLKTKRSNVSFMRVPVAFNQLAAMHVRAYYAAETLGVADQIHEAFFTEIHVNKNRLGDEKSLVAFFEKHGVDKDKLLEAMKSFAVDSKMRKAQAISTQYKIQSVPTIGVNGKYTTDGRMAGSYSKLFQIVDHLADKEAAGQSPSGEG